VKNLTDPVALKKLVFGINSSRYRPVAYYFREERHYEENQDIAVLFFLLVLESLEVCCT
jgi:hypothetical protein